MKVIATENAGYSQQFRAEIIKGEEYDIPEMKTLPTFFKKAREDKKHTGGGE
jgi:hypothetical protein